MNLSKTFARVALGAYVAPPENPGDTRGEFFMGRYVLLGLPDAVGIWSARLIMGAADQGVVMDLANSDITASLNGVQQILNRVVVAAAGCTAAGNLVVTVTSFGMAGSPLAVNVPLTPRRHTTAALITAEIVKALNGVAVIAARFLVTSSGGQVTLKRRFAAANDGTLALSIGAGLGVTNGAADGAGGTAGVVIERLGGNTNDVHGLGLSLDKIQAIFLKVTDDSPAGVTTNFIDALEPGEFNLWGGPGRAVTDLTITATDQSILDLIIVGK